jgi:4-hydroxythreonine-4-phosphate dehydrogenase
VWTEQTIVVIEPEGLPREEFVVGKINAANGRAAHACIVAAVNALLSGHADALCTAPIAKEAMFTAGFDFPGHTELLSRLCGNAPVRMMLEGGGLHVVLQTIHVPLASVPSLLNRESILETLNIINRWAKVYFGNHPKIAVCGLNPHAGEGGHFGSEETEIISPAIKSAISDGIKCSGPYPADTVFHRAIRGDFDIVLAMYHDQALIPVKTLDFDHGVNTTIGLPIIRTSPDHGTAFDIAGKGMAKETSMTSAVLRAAQLASERTKHS